MLAEEVHAAYAEVIQTAGYDYPFRCGRATGFSFLERPQLVAGDRTVLEPGMVFFLHMVIFDDDEGIPATADRTYLVTENGAESLSKSDLALPVI